MASSKDLRAHRAHLSEQFQRDIDASVVFHDPPIADGYGNSWGWSVTLPDEEYQQRRDEIGALDAQVREAEDAERWGLAADFFLYQE